MPIASLQGLDSNARVIYTGTLSKVLFPSLRLGYIVIPPDLVDRFAAVRQSMDICPQPCQPGHTCRIYPGRPLHSPHPPNAQSLRRTAKAAHRGNRTRVKHLLHCDGADAGMHLTLMFRDKFDDRQVAKKAIQRKLWLSALSLSYIGRSPRHGLVLGFGNTPLKQIPGAILSLSEILSD